MSKTAVDQVFQTPELKLMNHVVAGYPSPKLSMECIKVMEQAGTDLIEIQIPFSDPMADGPTIVKANHSALAQGMNLNEFWKWLSEVRKETQVPLLLMTYYNIPLQMGLRKFFSQAQERGISGVIIPDITFDNTVENYLHHISEYDIHPIQVISPSVNKERLQKISTLGSGFVYTTLKVGITGSNKNQEDGVNFLKTVRKYFSLPIAAGFGINSPEQVSTLRNKADMVVIGSHVIRLQEDAIQQGGNGLQTVHKFIKLCKQSS